MTGLHMGSSAAAHIPLVEFAHIDARDSTTALRLTRNTKRKTQSGGGVPSVRESSSLNGMVSFWTKWS